MKRRQQIGPALVITLGVILIAGGLAYREFLRAIEQPTAAALPDSLAGLPQAETSYGPDAVAMVTNLHGKQFPLSSGAYGMYGEHGRMAMLWVAGTPAKAMAARMVDEMEEAIARGDSPFMPTGTREENGRTLYELTGMGQQHTYFQSGSLVVWLAADQPVAAVALEEALQFYP